MEMNKQLGGGASPQIVKAVLDNIGHRYLVEHWESEDSSQEYDLYSDGFIVQRCKQALEGNSLTFPKEFRDLNYRISIGTSFPSKNVDTRSPATNYVWAWFGISKKSTTGFEPGGSGTSSTITLDIVAQGYAA